MKHDPESSCFILKTSVHLKTEKTYPVDHVLLFTDLCYMARTEILKEKKSVKITANVVLLQDIFEIATNNLITVHSSIHKPSFNYKNR